MKDSVIIVNEQDQMTGTMDKLAAHRKGVLHRALSVFIFNHQGELLLQQRAFGKYHSGGLWSNTCCSHPGLGETIIEAAHRRLKQEMGMACELVYAFNFMYKEDMGNGLIEHEFDHVFFGITADVPEPDPAEAAGYKYMPMDELSGELRDHPEAYSKWLDICFEKVMETYIKLFDHEQLAD